MELGTKRDCERRKRAGRAAEGRDQLAAELAMLDRGSTKPAKASDRDAEVEAIIGRVWTLADDLQKASRPRAFQPALGVNRALV
jgi:hypothetical protein